MKKIIDFKREKLGVYTEPQIKKTWASPSWFKGVEEGRCSIVKDGKKRVLRATYPKGEVGPTRGGVDWEYSLEGDHKEFYVQYKVKFPKGFCFVRGGKLPGLIGGTAPTGGSKDLGGFSARIMWRVDNFHDKHKIKDPYKAYLCQYVYYPDKKSSKKWGQDFNWVDPDTRDKCYFIPGNWHTLKTRVKMNTAGKSDGVITSWFDDKQVLDIKLMLRQKEGSFGIDAFSFITFFGGNKESWAPIKNENVYFDEFMFSERKLK